MENDENVPKGPFDSTCGGCSFNEETHTLSCKKCDNGKGEFVESTLEVTEGCTIIFQDGTLKCQPTRDTMADKNAKEPTDKKEL